MLLQSNAAIVLCMHNAAVSPSDARAKARPAKRQSPEIPPRLWLALGVPPPSKGQESVRSGRAGVDAERQSMMMRARLFIAKKNYDGVSILF
jgi:hypothetical protein